MQGRITDSGNIIVNRPVPIALVKEIWFCIPKDNSARGFDYIEKIMDSDLEDELVLEYQASPILHEFRRTRTPARLMQLLQAHTTPRRNGYFVTSHQLLTVQRKMLGFYTT